MRVVLDVTPAMHHNAGIGRYAEELARAILAHDTSHELRLFYADRLARSPEPPLDTLPRRVIRSTSKPWRLRVLLSTYARVPMDDLVGEADVFHATDHLLPPLRHMRSVFTLYDLSFLHYPQTHLPLNRWFLRLMVPVFLRRADAIICISAHTKADALRCYPSIDESKVHVVPLGVNERFHAGQDIKKVADVRARYGLPERFILFVGTLEPRKNLLTLLRAFERLRARGARQYSLVLVGRQGWKAEAFLSALESSPARGAVLLTGAVPEADLPALYSAADLFVYPSLYEGFGLPPLEAMACGTPVIASSASSLPEVVADAGVLVAPTDEEALEEAMYRVLSDDALRAALAAKGVARASLFSWASTARLTLAICEAAHRKGRAR